MFGSSKEKPQKTTDSILEELKTKSPDNVVARIGDMRFLVPTSTVKLLAWNSVPDMIKDPDSPDAKKHSTLRSGLKALIRPFLPEILKKIYGVEVEIAPRLNVLTWLPEFLIHLLVTCCAAKEWNIHVEKCAGCEGDVYKVVGISPDTGNQPYASPLSETFPPANHQSLPGRTSAHHAGQTDTDEPGGSLGNRGNDRQWENDIRQGITQASENRLSSDADIHP